MKKILFISIAFISLFFTSCEKEEVGGTATQSMAGDWVVTFTDGADYSYTIPHGLTFNTSANVPTEMWVSDGTGNDRWWWFQAKVKCDLNTLTFASDGWVENATYESKVRITNGKITLNGMTLPSGRVVDTIYYDIEFDDEYDDDTTPTVWHAYGRRYTGFAEDN